MGINMGFILPQYSVSASLSGIISLYLRYRIEWHTKRWTGYGQWRSWKIKEIGESRVTFPLGLNILLSILLSHTCHLT